jgi:hypothetical protein
VLGTFFALVSRLSFGSAVILRILFGLGTKRVPGGIPSAML